jgi:Pvc16 N-terminal domain
VSDFKAIAATTKTLERLLIAKLGLAIETALPPVEISVSTPLVSIFLYRVEINPFLANLDWKRTSSTQLAAPPCGLNMHYLITPYGPDLVEIQKTLGEVIRTFHEYPVIDAADPLLSPDLVGMTEELRIVPRPLPLNDMLDLWKAFEKISYRLSVTYEVSAVLIDSGLSRSVVPVQERNIEVITLR